MPRGVSKPNPELKKLKLVVTTINVNDNHCSDATVTRPGRSKER